MAFAWSYSSLNLFETCGVKYRETKVTKTFADEPFDQNSYGNVVHKAFEMYVKCGDPLPLDLRHHQPYIDKFLTWGKPMSEAQLGMTRQAHQTGFFDRDVWWRGVVDLVVLNGSRAYIIDYKTGKKKKDFDQVELTCCVLAHILPEVDSFAGIYYWTKDKSTTHKVWTRKELLSDRWMHWVRRADQMEKCIEEDRFTEKPGGLCDKYCPVRSCKFNGKYMGAA